MTEFSFEGENISIDLDNLHINGSSACLYSIFKLQTILLSPVKSNLI